LVEHGIAKDISKQAVKRLLKIQPTLDHFPYPSPSQYFSRVWAAVSAGSDFSGNMAGECFELVIACVLLREGILPFYMQAEVQYVPDARFDILIYTKEIGPVALSLKTSLRERYKQAELEALSLRSVHRKAETYLLTNNVIEGQGRQKQIDEGVLIGIKEVVIPDSKDFDTLISYLKKLTPQETGYVPIITLPSSGRFVS
jgi:hypothetical protein